ncbi:hypothetical protein P7C73_g2193, partial [Tremellales sp. Uapishka_1]
MSSPSHSSEHEVHTGLPATQNTPHGPGMAGPAPESYSCESGQLTVYLCAKEALTTILPAGHLGGIEEEPHITQKPTFTMRPSRSSPSSEPTSSVYSSIATAAPVPEIPSPATIPSALPVRQAALTFPCGPFLLVMARMSPIERFEDAWHLFVRARSEWDLLDQIFVDSGLPQGIVYRPGMIINRLLKTMSRLGMDLLRLKAYEEMLVRYVYPSRTRNALLSRFFESTSGTLSTVQAVLDVLALCCSDHPMTRDQFVNFSAYIKALPQVSSQMR